MYNIDVNVRKLWFGMNKVNNLLQELGVSKVKLAKYLGVSRQMVYNYLMLDNLEKWPKEKKLLLLQLLDLKTGEDEEIDEITVNTEYLMDVEKRLNMGVKTSNEINSYLDLKGLDKEKKTLFNDLVNVIKDKLEDDDVNGTNTNAIRYIYYMIQSMENVPEINYILGYMAKTTGFISPEENAFDEDKQYIFEGILYTALSLYNNGGASKSKVAENHRKFIQEIEQKKEEKLSRTQQLNTTKVQALRELGYTEINEKNAQEVLEKIAEIQTRKV